MKDIIFIHGMFQNPTSWTAWERYFGERGFQCEALAWPLHEGEPSHLRNHPPEGLGDLHLDDVVTDLEARLLKFDKPIVIGHSVGGLIVQLFANRNLISLGVAISSVAPNKMLDFDWNFIKNSALIANPFKGNESFYMDEKSFHDSFANTLSKEASKEAWFKFATHDSRNILRDCLGKPGEINLEIPHVPLLFIGGEEDKIIPDSLVRKNAEAYRDESSVVDYKIYSGRSHFICGESGWEEVAEYIYIWIKGQSQHSPYI